jgi:hypothetical protein
VRTPHRPTPSTQYETCSCPFNGYPRWDPQFSAKQTCVQLVAASYCSYPYTARFNTAFRIPFCYDWFLRTELQCQTYTYMYMYVYMFFLWRCDPTRVMASSIFRFLDHTRRRTTVGRTPLDEWSARRGDLYLTTHNTHNRQISSPPVGFEPIIWAGERPQTNALERAATETRARVCVCVCNGVYIARSANSGSENTVVTCNSTQGDKIHTRENDALN